MELPLRKELLIQVPNQSKDENLNKALKQCEEILSQKLEELEAKPTGRKISIKFGCMNNLIENVHISPRAPGWFKPLLETIIKRYGLQCEVKKSDLDNDPLL